MTLWKFITIIGILMVLLLGLLICWASPSPGEPRFIRLLRLKMWAETLGLIGHALRHPGLFSYRATKAEKIMSLPGDKLIPVMDASATYGVTIRASVEKIWPWLVQMGYGRAMWYAWSPMHIFPEYKHHISPIIIHPEWQNLKVGDILLDGDALNQCSENKGAWRVMEIHDRRAIVFFSARDFMQGIEFNPQRIRPEQIYGIISWVFCILPVNEQQSRLLIRTRAELGPGKLRTIARLLFGCMDAAFERTVLEGIKHRVENYAKP